MRERERETDRQRERERDRETDREITTSLSGQADFTFNESKYSGFNKLDFQPMIIL